MSKKKARKAKAKRDAAARKWRIAKAARGFFSSAGIYISAAGYGLASVAPLAGVVFGDGAEAVIGIIAGAGLAMQYGGGFKAVQDGLVSIANEAVEEAEDGVIEAEQKFIGASAPVLLLPVLGQEEGEEGAGLADEGLD